MSSFETRIIFFQVSDLPSKLRCITETARSHFSKKEAVLFFVENEKGEAFLDELLWKLPEHSFLPHAISNQKTDEKIAITKTKENVNGAIFAFNLCPTPLLVPG
ncbi:MAG: DNA polymerase III subunit chi, partial [Chlamydiae bacterium]|nr:DNA polymerase III subunit chi [Chlamydiota bacterium]